MDQAKPDLDLTDSPTEMLPTAKVTPRADRGWRHFCSTHGVTYAAVAEAIGLWMADHEDTPKEALAPEPQWVVETARKVMQHRRSRKR